MATLNRRQVIGTGATIGAGALLAACGTDDTDTTSTDSATTPDAASESPTSDDTQSSSDDATSGSADGIVATSDVPEGGGVVLSDEEIVVTQPSSGDYKAFTAICTHSGCLVGSVEDGEIICPCHASHFSIDDGSVLSGPAPSALASVAVEVVDGQVVKS